MRLVEETNVGTDHAKIKIANDSGYRARRAESVAEGIFSETQYGYGFVELTDIRIAALGNDAGIIGAAVLGDNI